MHRGLDEVVTEAMERKLALGTEAMERKLALGTEEFYIQVDEMKALIQHVLEKRCDARVAINRVQKGTGGLVHRLEWRGLQFMSVSSRPIRIG